MLFYIIKSGRSLLSEEQPEEAAVEAEKSKDEELIAMVRAAAGYGHHVQPFLADSRIWILGTDCAESCDIGNAQTAVSEKEVRKENKTNGNITKITCSLTLDSQTGTSLCFTPKSGYTGKFNVTADGTTAQAKKVRTLCREDLRHLCPSAWNST